jgi:hypothetical protein
MNKRERDAPEPLQFPGACRSNDVLPYCIELWAAEDGDTVERILARVADVQLARAIFEKARGDHPARRVTLRRGREILGDSAS